MTVISDPIPSCALYLCVQQGISPGLNCVGTNNSAGATTWPTTTFFNFKTAVAQYVSPNGVSPASQADFRPYDCTSSSNRNPDGVAMCWGRTVTPTDATKATSSTNPVIIRHWLYMAADHADFTNGYRFWPGQQITTQLVEASGGVSRAWGNVIQLAGAVETLAITTAFVSGALYTLF